jgi:hypothetical protein
MTLPPPMATQVPRARGGRVATAPRGSCTWRTKDGRRGLARSPACVDAWRPWR